MRAPAALTARTLAKYPLPELNSDADKEARGEVLVIGSSATVPGAAMLSGLAALRAGAGKLKLAVPRSLSLAMGLGIPECGMVALPQTSDGEPRLATQLKEPFSEAAAIVAGPGIMSHTNARAMARGLLQLPRTGVLIADASILANLPLNRPKQWVAKPLIVTPHHGEIATLLGVDRAQIARDPLRHARNAADRLGALVILKAETTYVVTPTGLAWVHVGGLPGLATSGSGDILAGILAGLIARGTDALSACLWAVVTHARAGGALRDRVGALGFLARELLPEIPGLLSSGGGRRRS